MELRGCPLGRASHQECFDDANHEFIFVKDLIYDMPADDEYPERGYYYGGQTSGIREFKMEFKVPPGLVGIEVLLQVSCEQYISLSVGYYIYL